MPWTDGGTVGRCGPLVHWSEGTRRSWLGPLLRPIGLWSGLLCRRRALFGCLGVSHNDHMRTLFAAYFEDLFVDFFVCDRVLGFAIVADKSHGFKVSLSWLVRFVIPRVNKVWLFSMRIIAFSP